MVDQIPVLQFSRDGLGIKDHSYSHKLGVFQHLKPHHKGTLGKDFPG